MTQTASGLVFRVQMLPRYLCWDPWARCICKILHHQFHHVPPWHQPGLLIASFGHPFSSHISHLAMEFSVARWNFGSGCPSSSGLAKEFSSSPLWPAGRSSARRPRPRNSPSSDISGWLPGRLAPWSSRFASGFAADFAPQDIRISFNLWDQAT